MKRWQRPNYAELRMDAEIGSYQDDFGSDERPLFVSGEDDLTEAVPTALGSREG